MPGNSLWANSHLSRISEKWILDKDYFLRYDADRGYISPTTIVLVEPEEFDFESRSYWTQIINQTNLQVLKVKGYVDLDELCRELNIEMG